MNTLDALEHRRRSAKIAYEAAWKVGDPDAEAWAFAELTAAENELRIELKRIELEDQR